MKLRINIDTRFAIGDDVWVGDDPATIIRIRYDMCVQESGKVKESVQYKVRYWGGSGATDWVNGGRIEHYDKEQRR